jgi:hypothetical protein
LRPAGFCGGGSQSFFYPHFSFLNN